MIYFKKESHVVCEIGGRKRFSGAQFRQWVCTCVMDYICGDITLLVGLYACVCGGWGCWLLHGWSRFVCRCWDNKWTSLALRFSSNNSSLIGVCHHQRELESFIGSAFIIGTFSFRFIVFLIPCVLCFLLILVVAVADVVFVRRGGNGWVVLRGRRCRGRCYSSTRTRMRTENWTVW